MSPTEASPEGPDLPHVVEVLVYELEHGSVRRPHAVADHAVTHLGIDVFEHCDVILRHPNPQTARALWANARAAIEAGIEMLFITADEGEYDLRGASARAFELLENHQLQRRMRRADEAAGVAEPSIPGDPEYPALTDAGAWDGISPGKGKVMRQAFEAVQAGNARGEKHWSGRSFTAMVWEAAEAHNLGAGALEIVDAFYGAASIHSHPRVRSNHRATVRNDDGGFDIVPGHDDSEAMRDLARTAAMFAIQGLRKRAAY